MLQTASSGGGRWQAATSTSPSQDEVGAGRERHVPVADLDLRIGHREPFHLDPALDARRRAEEPELDDALLRARQGARGAERLAGRGDREHAPSRRTIRRPASSARRGRAAPRASALFLTPSWAIACESAGCATPSRRAALVICPSSATATKYSRWPRLNVIAPPMGSLGRERYRSVGRGGIRRAYASARNPYWTGGGRAKTLSVDSETRRGLCLDERPDLSREGPVASEARWGTASVLPSRLIGCVGISLSVPARPGRGARVRGSDDAGTRAAVDADFGQPRRGDLDPRRHVAALQQRGRARTRPSSRSRCAAAPRSASGRSAAAICT